MLSHLLLEHSELLLVSHSEEIGNKIKQKILQETLQKIEKASELGTIPPL